MILGSPFSRNNRSHQTWTNGSTSSATIHHHQQPQLPLPQHNRMPQLQSSTVPRKPKMPLEEQFGGKLHSRPTTLNKLNFQRNRSHSVRGMVTSGVSGNMPRLPSAQTNGRIGSFANGLSDNSSQIYAPASIASPHEYYTSNINKHSPTQINDSHHYAVTSFRGETPGLAASESGRSGRESALGSLIGTLKRKVKWTTKSYQQHQKQVENKDKTTSRPNDGPSYKAKTPIDPDNYAQGKRELQAEEIYAEGLEAINSNGEKRLPNCDLDDLDMKEGEFRTIIEDKSKNQADYLALKCILTNWINDELAQQRIIIKDLDDDLYDGQILGKLLEKLQGIQLDIIEVTQNETTQKHRLRTVLSTINRILSTQARWAPIRWSVEGIHGRNMIEILHLLITLTRYYKAPIKLPSNVRINAVIVQKFQGQLLRRSHEVQLTESSTLNNSNLPSNGRDAFDTLFEVAPEKLHLVKRSLVKFCNRHLNKINMSCSPSSANSSDVILNPDQFSDGLLLVFLIASLENYFVPLGNLFTTTVSECMTHKEYQQLEPNSNRSSNILENNGTLQTAIETTSYVNTQPIFKLHNVNVAFQLMNDAGIVIRDKVRAEDIVNGDLKSILRVLYALFSRYKHL